MKRIKHFALALAAVILLSNINYVQANELDAAETIQTNGEISVASTIQSYRFPRQRTTFTVGTLQVTSTSTLTLQMPRDNGLSLVQGTITFLPIASSGSQYSFSFTNLYKEVVDIDLSSVAPGAYIVKIEGASIGTNETVTVTLIFI